MCHFICADVLFSVVDIIGPTNPTHLSMCCFICADVLFSVDEIIFFTGPGHNLVRKQLKWFDCMYYCMRPCMRPCHVCKLRDLMAKVNSFDDLNKRIYAY